MYGDRPSALCQDTASKLQRFFGQTAAILSPKRQGAWRADAVKIDDEPLTLPRINQGQSPTGKKRKIKVSRHTQQQVEFINSREEQLLRMNYHVSPAIAPQPPRLPVAQRVSEFRLQRPQQMPTIDSGTITLRTHQVKFTAKNPQPSPVPTIKDLQSRDLPDYSAEKSPPLSPKLSHDFTSPMSHKKTNKQPDGKTIKP